MTRTLVVASCVLVASVLVAASAGAEIVDRILAVVDGSIILQSDVSMAVRLGLVSAVPVGDASAGPLDALIERRLILEEVDRYAPPDPPDPDVDRKLSEIRARVGARLDTILVESGVSAEQLRRYLRDDLRLEAYLQQRFGTMQPSDDEIRRYYREHQPEFMRKGAPAPLEEVREVVRAELIADRRSTMIREWLVGLRRRANVNVLPR